MQVESPVITGLISRAFENLEGRGCAACELYCVLSALALEVPRLIEQSGRATPRDPLEMVRLLLYWFRTAALREC